MKKLLSILGIAAVFASLLVGFDKPAEASSTELLTSPWQFVMNNGDSQKYVTPAANVLNGKVSLTVTYDLNGTCLLGGDASALIFDQSGWKYVSLSNYGQNCYDGEQIVTIPLSAFTGLNTASNITPSFHARFWKGTGGPYTVDITSAKLNTPANVPPVATASATPTSGSGPLSVDFTASATDSDGTITSYAWAFGDGATASTQNPSHTYTATGNYTSTLTVTDNDGGTDTDTVQITVTSNPTWVLQSVDLMKYTKDVVCGTQPSDTFIANSISRAVELGATHVGIATPYENPTCGSSRDLAVRWITAARAAGLKIWHRHAHLAFEGIYSTSKTKSPDGTRFHTATANWITANADLIAPGDIFTPEAEPQNGGIAGVTYCGNPSVCQFSSAADFNEWLRTAQLVSKLALQANGFDVATTLGDSNGVFVGLYGFDGFVTWGNDNPDHVGTSKLEASTVAAMDNIIAIDHYPSAQSMATDLDEAHAMWPNAQYVIGEYGTIGATTETARQTAAEDAFSAFAARSWIKGVNYWHLHWSNEGLLNTDFTKRANFTVVEGYYK